jgi:hypothetical protein
MEPREYAERIEQTPELPSGNDERLGGYGVMGAPFASGHVLAMRRFSASSVGGGYASVWHRDPDGAWTFYTSIEPLRACPRYFGAEARSAVECSIDVAWPGPRVLRVGVPSAGLAWEVELASTAATRALNAMARLMPDRLWKDRRVLSMMAAIAGPMLRAGRLGVQGRAPNGQAFVANPMVLWTIARTTATIGGADLGLPGSLAEQTRLGDFWIPQRGLFAVGRAFFETFDPARHLAVACRDTTVPTDAS